MRTCHCLFCECACCPRHNHFISGSSLFSVCAGCFVLFFRPGPHAKTCSVSEPETERSCLEDACSSCSVPQPSFVWRCLCGTMLGPDIAAVLGAFRDDAAPQHPWNPRLVDESRVEYIKWRRWFKGLHRESRSSLARSSRRPTSDFRALVFFAN